jgi:hypothetical protein
VQADEEVLWPLMPDKDYLAVLAFGAKILMG